MKGYDDLDAEDYLAGLIHDRQYQSAANYLHNLAALRAAEMPRHAVNCPCRHCERRRLDHQIRIRRQYEAALRLEAAA
ncbi:hypothetical protein ACFQ2B_27620 [Streptomyces stramineus]|uniref:Transposase n=1 Tax=Streptomyces stramineus TaxID=173861 RepID=A0ABN0ZNW7_9ACTN